MKRNKLESQNGMNVLLVNGSPHKNGGTARSLAIIEEELHRNHIDTTWFQVGAEPVRGCVACGRCVRTNRCSFGDDKCNELIELMLSCNGMIIGSPVYFAGPNGALLALLDRAFYATCNFNQSMAGKPGASVVSVWREGGTAALDRLNKYFLFSQMPIASSNYWPVNWNQGNDRYARDILTTLGNNYAALLIASHRTFRE